MYIPEVAGGVAALLVVLAMAFYLFRLFDDGDAVEAVSKPPEPTIKPSDYVSISVSMVDEKFWVDVAQAVGVPTRMLLPPAEPESFAASGKERRDADSFFNYDSPYNGRNCRCSYHPVVKIDQI